MFNIIMNSCKYRVSVQVKARFYQEFLEHIQQKPSNVSTIFANILGPNLRLDDQAPACLKCQIAVYTMINYFDTYHSSSDFTTQFVNVLRELCSSLTSQSTSKCEGYARVYAVSKIIKLLLSW